MTNVLLPEPPSIINVRPPFGAAAATQRIYLIDGLSELVLWQRGGRDHPINWSEECSRGSVVPHLYSDIFRNVSLVKKGVGVVEQSYGVLIIRE